MKLFDITGKSVLITGATSGLGMEYAKFLASEGAETIIAVGRRLAMLESVQKTIEESTRAKVIPIQCDVSSENDVVNKLANLKQVDILINNAGITEKSKDITEQTEEQWHRVIETNLSGTYRVSREVVKLMKRQNYGKIVNIASVFAAMGACNQVSYAASKGGVVALTRAMAMELAPYNITVNAILPGYCESAMTDPNSGGYRYFVSRTPLGRIGKAEDLFGALLLLASDASRWMTGSVITVDGGHTANL